MKTAKFSGNVCNLLTIMLVPVRVIALLTFSIDPQPARRQKGVVKRLPIRFRSDLCHAAARVASVSHAVANDFNLLPAGVLASSSLPLDLDCVTVTMHVQSTSDGDGDAAELSKLTGMYSVLKMPAFYRATLCVSVVFAVGRCLSVCLSVRLSVCHVRGLYPNGSKISSNFFISPLAPSF